MYKIAIIGAGRIAHEHIKTILSIKDFEIVGIHSRSYNKAKEIADLYSIKHVYASIEDLFNHCQPNAVIVCVSVTETKRVIDVTSNYPWIQLIEKPAGLNLIDANEISKIIVNKNAKAFVAFNRRFYSSTQIALKELINCDSNRIVVVQDNEDPTNINEDSRPDELIKYWMYANSIHLIDYFRIFCRGDIQSVTPTIEWNPRNPFYLQCNLNFKSGDIGVYQAFWGAPGPWGVSITNKYKRIELRPLERLFVHNYGGTNLEKQVDSDDSDFKAGFKKQLLELLKAIKGEFHQLVTIEDSLKTMKLINLIYGI